MTQLSADEILIVGGFNGKFMADNHIIKLDRNSSVESVQSNQNPDKLSLFPF